MDTYKFLWKGTSREGTRRHVEIHASNAAAARLLLQDQGWSDLELVADEAGTVSGNTTDAPKWIREEPAPAEQLGRYFDGTAPGFLKQWWQSMRQSWLSLVICAGLVAVGVYRAQWLPITIGVIGLAFLLLLGPLFHLWFSVPLRLYSQLNRAKVWADWDTVLICVERLRKSHRLLRVGVGEVELTRCRSQALAGQGRLDEALAGFAALEGSAELPRWMYLSHLAGIYENADRFDKALEARRQAAADKPDTAVVWIDLAYGLVRRLNHPVEAREALAKAETLELTGIARNYVPFLQGMILWREGKLKDAKTQFEDALVNFTSQHPKNELLEGLMLLAKAHLCALHRRLGNHDAAGRLFQEVERFLRANRETELLQACR